MTAEERVEKMRSVVTGMRHRADTLAGTGTSIAADELRHMAAVIEKILGDDS